MRVIKAILYFLLFIVLLLSGLAATGLVLSYRNDIHQSHDTPYLRADMTPVEKPGGEPNWRVLLLGDAGNSTLNPWHPTLALAAKLAAEKPERTSVILLGDNIYMKGYPTLEAGQGEFDQQQLELIDRLNAQLQISKRSGAELFLVPGNHDWYAEQVDDQAHHVANYATEQGARVDFAPWKKGQSPLPEALHRPGFSLVFLDTQWLLTADPAQWERAVDHLRGLVAAIESAHPDHTVLVVGHHPLQTMGPHAQFYTRRGYAAIMSLIELFVGLDQDITHPAYQRFIAALTDALTSDNPVIYAAGHEHSLQVFEGLARGPDYQLVSGAANQSKVSGVGHNERTRFAVSQEGLMQLSWYPEGVLLEVVATRSQQVIHRQWLN